MLKNNVIVSMARTAIGDFGGSLKSKSAQQLGTIAVKAAMERAGIDPKSVDEVILGCVGEFGVDAFIARMVAVNAGCDEKTTGLTVNRLCSSGLQALWSAAVNLENHDAEIMVAGGTESMSNYPYMLNSNRWGARMGTGAFDLEDSLTTALCEPFTGPQQHIAITAQNIAERFGFTREDIDKYALESQNRALKAVAEGKFRDEIVPIEIKTKKESFVFDTDEHPRDTSLEKLAKLRPILGNGTMITAGNAAGVNDAAAAMVMMTPEKAEKLGIKPIARLIDGAVCGVDPNYMGLGPVASTKRLLEKTGMKLTDFGLIELNEAFAPQAMGCIKELGLDMDKVNVNGSGISLGHPIGATGAIISVKLIEEMRRRNVKYGMSTLCIGGGQGMSVAFELI